MENVSLKVFKSPWIFGSKKGMNPVFYLFYIWLDFLKHGYRQIFLSCTFTESCLACFFIIILFYWIYTEYAAVHRLSWNSNWLLTPPPPPLPRKNCSFNNFPLFSLYVSLKTSTHIRLNLALVGCLFLFGCLEKSFLEAIIKPSEGTRLAICKIYLVPQYPIVFFLIWLHG